MSGSITGRGLVGLALVLGNRLAAEAPDAAPVHLDEKPASAAVAPVGWHRLPPYPRELGVAGIIAGRHGDVVIAAGGANFPDVPWRDGGVKVYYDDIHVLDLAREEWQAAGRLPEPRGYSGVVSVPGGVLVAGGENADGVRADVFLLRWENGKVERFELPTLPAPRSSPAIGLLEGKVYLAGGYGPEAGRPSTADFWCLDLSNVDAGWRALPSWPGPRRGQAVMAVADGAIHLISGLQVAPGKAPDYLADAYRYRTDSDWEKLPPPPRSAVAAPSPAPVVRDTNKIFVLGGVDGRLVGKTPPGTRVPSEILVYDVAAQSWSVLPEPWPEPVVTGPAVQVGEAWYIISGEVTAGIRTPESWVARPREWNTPP